MESRILLEGIHELKRPQEDNLGKEPMDDIVYPAIT